MLLPQRSGPHTKPAPYTVIRPERRRGGLFIVPPPPWRNWKASPPLKGPAFGEMATAQGLTAAALLDVIVNTMPQSDPGALKPEEYNAVTAYILQQNGYPAGGAALAPGAAGLKDAKITP